MGIKLGDLKPSDAGRPFVCDIGKVKNVTGKINHERGDFYLCQDVKNGYNHVDLLGYCFAWLWKDEKDGVKNFLFTDTKESQWSNEIIKGIYNYFSFDDYDKGHFCPAPKGKYPERCKYFCEEIFKPMGFKKTDESKCPCRVYGKETVEARFNTILSEAGKEKKGEKWYKLGSAWEDEAGKEKKEEKRYKLGSVWEDEEDNEPYVYSACGKWDRVFVSIEDGDRWDDVWKTKRSKFEEEFIEEVNRDGLKYTGFDSIEDYYRDKFCDGSCKNITCPNHSNSVFSGCAIWSSRNMVIACDKYKPKG